MTSLADAYIYMTSLADAYIYRLVLPMHIYMTSLAMGAYIHMKLSLADAYYI